jgi:trehalose synthase-fused probable maltokinase
VPSAAFPATLPRELDVRRIGGEQSNTSVVFGNAVIVKHFRRIVSGLNPEAEVTRFLTERTTFRNAPQLFGHLEYRDAKGDVATLAVAQEVVAQAQDGWQWVLAELRAMSERARGAAPDPTTLRDAAASTLDALRRLGTRTAELHRALGSDPRDPAFAPEPIRREDLELWSDAVRRQVSAAFSALGRGKPPDARNVVDGLAGLLGRHRIRHHGDFHLGQTLYQPERGDFVIIDFEGEPLRPFDERRRKHAALRDVAGMLRSIDYAAATGVPVGLEAWSSAWRAAAAEEFVAAYRAGAAGAMFVPDSERAFDAAVAVFELEKAAYEVVYEANNRPDWIGIPTRGLDRALSAISGRAAAGAA